MKPNQKRVQLTLRIPEELNQCLIKIANEKAIPKNTLIILKLWELKEAKNK